MIDDKNIVLQIFGCLIKNPSLIGQTDKYSLTPSDFKTSFEKRLFVVICSLYEKGAKNLSLIDIENYLKDTPGVYELWEKEHGADYVQDAEDLSDLGNFNYYYNKLKKINTIRSLQKMGYNTSEFYEEDTLSPNYQKINQKFEELTVKDIIDSVRKKISEVERENGINKENKVDSANAGIEDLVDRLKLSPDTGPRLQGKYFNTIVRGARKGKFFLRTAGSGVGKSRSMVGDACYLAYPVRYSNEKQAWEWAGACEKVLYIATEQEIEEIQTMILAYLSGINEDCILFGTYNEEQEKILKQAMWVMNHYSENLQIGRMPNPNISQLQFVVREAVLENNIENVFYDYIFTNPALLNEYRDLKVADHQILGMFSSELKNLAVELDIFVMSSTQTNAQAEDSSRGIKNESVIRGSRAIVDKVDMGCVMARPTDEELNIISSICNSPIPNLVTDIYKMRRGRYTQVRIWSYMDLGTCRKEDLIVTDSKLEPVEIFNLKQQYDTDENAFAINTVLNELNRKTQTVEIDDNNITFDVNTGEVTEQTKVFSKAMESKIEERKNNMFFGLL